MFYCCEGWMSSTKNHAVEEPTNLWNGNSIVKRRSHRLNDMTSQHISNGQSAVLSHFHNACIDRDKIDRDKTYVGMRPSNVK